MMVHCGIDGVVLYGVELVRMKVQVEKWRGRWDWNLLVVDKVVLKRCR